MDKLNCIGVSVKEGVGSMSETGTAMGRLMRVCGLKNIKIIQGRYIVLGEGVLLDKEVKIVVVSDNTSKEDIILATQYIENMTT